MDMGMLGVVMRHEKRPRILHPQGLQRLARRLLHLLSRGLFVGMP